MCMFSGVTIIVNLLRRIHVYILREKEENHSRQLIMPVELLLPFALVDPASLLSGPPAPSLSLAKVSHHSLRMLPNICVRVCECTRRGGGVGVGGINSTTVSQSFRCLFLSPSFPTSPLRLGWAQVSQSSAEGQTDFTVVGKRVMCLTGAGGLYS